MRQLCSMGRGLGLAALCALGGCSSQSSSESGSALPPNDRANQGAAMGGRGASANIALGTGGSSALVPAEVENDAAFGTQVATGRFVWAANPLTDRVALVDAQCGCIGAVLEAGFKPTYLAGVPDLGGSGANRAVVINVGSHDATLLEAPPAPNTAPVNPPQNVPVHLDANAWAVSANGRWAIAWTDSAQFTKPDPTQGFQDVTVIGLENWQTPTLTRLSVGYRPSAIFIDQSETRAFAVTDPGITVIDLSGAAPVVAQEFAVTEQPLSELPSHDVSFTPDGTWAIARHEGSPDLHLVDLETGALAKVSLPGNVTDLDLVGNGTAAVAVVREVTPEGTGGGSAGGTGGASGATATAGGSGNASGGAGGTAGRGGAAGAGTGGAAVVRPPPVSSVTILPVPGAFTAPEAVLSFTVPGRVLGSVATTEEGTNALLFTTAVDSPDLTILDTTQASVPPYRTISLELPIASVRATPDGRHAIALLKTSGGISSKAGAFAVIPVTEQRSPRIEGTDAPTHRVAISPDGKYAVITVRDDTKKKYAAYLVTMPELRPQSIELSSPPTDVGMVPEAGRAFVAQAHAEGRVTLINLGDGTSQTLTGFELGVENGP